MKPLKYNLLKLAAEFVLIITSIILSFYLQGKIDDRQSRKEAFHILTQVRTDLVSDTIKFRSELNNAERLIMVCNHLLTMNYDSVLKTEQDFDTTVFLIGETTTNLYTPIHVAGYTRLVNFGNKETIKDNPLIDSLISYYTVDKSKIESYYDVDRNFVDQIMIEKFLMNENYVMLNTFYTRKVLGAPYQPTIRQDIIDFLENKEVRGLFIFNIINKINYSKIVDYTRLSAYRKIQSLDEWLKRKS